MLKIRQQLFTISAVLEIGMGLAIVLAPAVTIRLLLNAEVDRIGRTIARLCGFALISLGIACWSARTDADSRARSGILRAIIFYNLAAGLLLIMTVATGKFQGIAIWCAGILHLGLAAGFVMTGRKS